MGATLEQIIDVKIKALVSGLAEVKKLSTELKGIEKSEGKKLSVNVTGGDRAVNLFRQLSSTGDGFIGRLQGIEKASGTSFGGMAAGAGIAGAALFGIGGALKFVYDKLNEIVMKAIEVGSRFHDLSIETGVEVETLSGLESQLRQSNTSLDELSDGVFFLQKNLKAAAEGNKDLQRAFARLGITDTNGALSDMDATLRQVLKSLAEMPDEGKRNAAGAEVMGRAYKQLRVFVEDLNGDVDGAIEKSRKLGEVMSQETADAADRLGDRMDDLRLRVERLRGEVGSRFLTSTENTLNIIEELLDRNADRWHNWADSVSDSLSGPIAGLLSAANAVRLFTLGVSPERSAQQNAEGLADSAIQNFKQALKKPGGVDFSPSGGGGGKHQGGGHKPTEPQDTFDSELSLQRARLDSAFNLLKDSLERENKAVEEQLRERLISIKDFYAEQERLQQRAIDAEIDQIAGLKRNEQLRHDHALEQIDAEQKKRKLTPDQANAKRIAEENKNKEENLRLEERLTLAQRKRGDIARQNASEERAALDALNSSISDFLDEVNTLNGRTSQIAIRAINERLEPLLEKVIQERGADSPLAQLIREFIALASDRARIDELLGRAGRLNDQFTVRAAEVQAHTAQNVIAEANARRELNALLQEYADKQLVILRQALLLAEANHDEEKIFDVRARIAEIEQLKNEQQSFNQELKNTAINVAATGLQTLFHDIVTGAKSAKEAMRDFLLSLLDALEQVIIKMIVVKILSIALGMGSSDGFFGNKDQVLGLDASFGDGHADGGLINGPGTETSDSIFARLSRGEFVIPAKAVRHYGVGFFEAIRNFSLPRIPAPGFALGGLADIPVGGNPATAGGGSTSNFNFQFARPEDRGFRLPTRAAFRDAARQLRGGK